MESNDAGVLGFAQKSNDNMEVSADNVLGFDPGTVKRLPVTELLKKVGPGFILAGIVLGPGSLTTSAMIGAQYGYRLLWIMIPVLFMGTTFMLTTYRLSMLTGMPSIHAIRHYYGKTAAGFVGIATFLACMFFTIGNISGIGAGMNLIFGINWKSGAMIIMAAILFCYFSKNVYNKIEKGIMAALCAMTIAFLVVLIMSGGPEPGEMARGLLQWKFPRGSLPVIIGFIGSSASLTTGIYGTYLGNEKKWKKQDLFNGVMMTDAAAHIFGVIIISITIILVGAIVMNPTGAAISTPADLAAMLVPVLGNTAPLVMGVALLASAFSAILGNTARGVVLFSAGVNQPTALDGRNIKLGSMMVLFVGTVICFSYGKSPVQLIYFSNVATGVATPVAGLFITRMIWRKDINRGIKEPRALQVCMTISYIFYLFVTIYALSGAVLKFINSIAVLF
ncbi:Nramp family divalent metal transporter [Lacrimispora sp. JR3]|uniref:Nramp family divalent metal transporter n=1 Tax=Lacrimispora sinapis TaxID=3111456 RepID=UPI00374808B2